MTVELDATGRNTFNVLVTVFKTACFTAVFLAIRNGTLCCTAFFFVVVVIVVAFWNENLLTMLVISTLIW
jgi:hypothetical protein